MFETNKRAVFQNRFCRDDDDANNDKGGKKRKKTGWRWSDKTTSKRMAFFSDQEFSFCFVCHWISHTYRSGCFPSQQPLRREGGNVAGHGFFIFFCVSQEEGKKTTAKKRKRETAAEGKQALSAAKREKRKKSEQKITLFFVFSFFRFFFNVVVFSRGPPCLRHRPGTGRRRPPGRVNGQAQRRARRAQVDEVCRAPAGQARKVSFRWIDLLMND